VGALQISRKGYEAALKTGMYLLSHLRYSNECERSADVVTTTFVNDEMQKANRVKYQCLKSRDNAPFQPFTSRVEYAYRRILTDFDGVDMYEGNAQGKKKFGTREDADLDQLLDPNKN
jgi:hypothetical protein